MTRTKTIALEHNDSMTYAVAHQADFDAAREESHPDRIAANAMPYAVYMDNARKQAWFCGWTAAELEQSR